jgi:subtilisin family serine protease
MLRRALGVAAVLAAAMTAGGAQAALPSDPLATGWTYDSIKLPAAWDLSTGSPSVVIAFVDSGVDASHPDLAGALVPGYDFVDEDADPADADPADIAGHETAVTGVAAARANNGLGAAGACWDCSVMPLRVLRPDNFASSDSRTSGCAVAPTPAGAASRCRAGSRIAFAAPTAIGG